LLLNFIKAFPLEFLAKKWYVLVLGGWLMKHIYWIIGLVLGLVFMKMAYAQEQMVYVNVTTANVRTGAGTQHPVLKVVPNGYPLKVLSKQGTWYKVQLKDERIGWVAQSTVSRDMPQAAKIAKLESQLEAKENELLQIKGQLVAQTKLNEKLKDKLKQSQQVIDDLHARTKRLEKLERVKLAGIGVGVLILGWIFGFMTGFFRRQAEDKRFIKMMVEAEALKKKD